MTLFWLIALALLFWLFFLNWTGFNGRSLQFLLVLTGIALILLTTFRPLTIPDTEGYTEIFDRIKNTTQFDLPGLKSLVSREVITGTEYGFVYLIRFLKFNIYSDYRFIFFVIASIEVICIVGFTKNMYGENIQRRLSFYCFFLPYFGYMYLFIAMRGGVALSLCLLAFSQTKSERRKTMQVEKAAILYFLAFIIHRLSVIFFLMEGIYYFLPRFKRKTLWIIWIMIGILQIASGLQLFHSVQNFLTSLSERFSVLAGYSGYFEETVGERTFGLRPLFFWGIAAMFLLPVSQKQYIRQNQIINIYVAGLIVMTMTGFIDGSFRIVDYILSVLPVLLSELDTLEGGRKKYQILVRMAELMYAIFAVAIIIRIRV